MNRPSSRRCLLLTAPLALLVLIACPAEREPVEDPDDPAALLLDFGVTRTPCPRAVNLDNGCIYLGTLSDLTVGPFASFGEQIFAGQEAFWRRVNERGGVGGLFDVDISRHVEDTEYNPAVHVRGYHRIVDRVAALTQTLGTPPTLAITEQMEADHVVGAVLTWWSGWELPRYDAVLQVGSNYCIDAMNGVEWAVRETGAQSVMTVYFPGDYGGDATAGVAIATAELGLDLLDEFQQVPIAAGGETRGAVSAILRHDPDLVFLTVGPTETAEIVGGAVARGYRGRFLGNHPTYDGALLRTAAGPALLERFHWVGPHESWGADTPGHRAMQAALGEGEQPGNDGFTFGWLAAYPVLAVLEHAVARGDLRRASIRAAVVEVEVDFEGILPPKRYAGEPNETVVRSTTIAAAAEVPERLGLETVEARFAGSVAAGFDFREPCQPID